MQFTAMIQTARDKFAARKVQLLTTMLATSLFMVSNASAGLNDSVGPVLQDVALIFVPLLAMILGAIPLIISLALIGFILGLLAAILLKMKV